MPALMLRAAWLIGVASVLLDLQHSNTEGQPLLRACAHAWALAGLLPSALVAARWISHLAHDSELPAPQYKCVRAPHAFPQAPHAYAWAYVCMCGCAYRRKSMNASVQLNRSAATQNARMCASLQVVREASWRVLGLRPFDVQLMGGMILHEGQIAEMRTGEVGQSYDLPG